MRVRHLAALASLCAITAACNDDNSLTVPECTEISNVTASTRGDTVITTTGLRYIDLTTGTAPVTTSCRAVALRYVGRLTNDAVFDSVPTNDRFVFTIGVNRLIPGFEQGVVGIGVGGQRRLIIPAELAYGAQSRPSRGVGFSDIPANSTLIFDVSVAEVQAP